MTLPPSTQATEILEPGEQALDLPASLVTLEFAPVLGLGLATPAMRSDEFDTVFVGQPGIELVRVVGFVADQANGEVFQEPLVEGALDVSCFMRASTSNPNGDRKTRAVRDRHDLGPLSTLSRPHSKSPFFADAKLP